MENNPSEHLSNIFTVNPTNGFAYLDNDTVKRTILAQEATFREQVLELHRLYNVQKNLMELEYQRGGLSEKIQGKIHLSPSGGIRTVHKVEPPTGRGTNKPSERIIKGKYIGCSSNGVSMKHNNSRSTQEKLLEKPANDSNDEVVILLENPTNSSARNKASTLGTSAKDLRVPAEAHDDVAMDLQVRADAHADDSDHDVVFLAEKPANSLARNNGSILGTTVKNFQFPTGARVDDHDDVVILLEKSANTLPGNDGSMLGKNVKPNIEGSSCMNKKLITGLQPLDVSTTDVLTKKVVGPSSNMETTNFPSVGCSSSQNLVYSSAGVKIAIDPSLHVSKNRVSGLQELGVSTVNVSNKKVVGSSSTMKIENFPNVGASSSQNQGYSSPGVNMNPPSLEDTLKGKHVGAAIGSNFFVANEETRHNNPYIHTKYDGTKHKKNGVDSSIAGDHPSYSICNPQTFTTTSSSDAFRSLWQSNTSDYTTRRYDDDPKVPNGQNGHLPTSKGTKLGGDQYQKQSQFYNFPKDVNLSNGPQDAIATLGQARYDTPMEISWVKNKLLNMRKEISRNKSQVPSNYAIGHPQIFPGSIVYSEGNTRILGFPINAAIDKNYQLSFTMHMGTDNTSWSKGVNNMEMQFLNKDNTNSRTLIDLNVALPFIDEMEIDARLSEGDTLPQEQDNSSNEALVVTATKNLMAMHKDKFHAGSPEGDNNDDDLEALNAVVQNQRPCVQLNFVSPRE